MLFCIFVDVNGFKIKILKRFLLKISWWSIVRYLNADGDTSQVGLEKKFELDYFSFGISVRACACACVHLCCIVEV